MRCEKKEKWRNAHNTPSASLQHQPRSVICLIPTLMIRSTAEEIDLNASKRNEGKKKKTESFIMASEMKTFCFLGSES